VRGLLTPHPARQPYKPYAVRGLLAPHPARQPYKPHAVRGRTLCAVS
jgi:hypothetical protein